MEGRIFLLKEDGSLIRMNQQRYEAEELLKQLLEKYPDLLAGDQIDLEAPHRFLLIAREVGVPLEDSSGGWWSLDHLFIDQDAVPTFVEVKRGVDTRSRREVVAQMLDYAANATEYWPVERMRELFVARCAGRGLEPDVELSAFLGPDADHEAFWEQARINLREGRVRLLFVADAIPPTLRRIIEFLNKQMNSAEVLAVEVPQFVGADGAVLTLVPRVVGKFELNRDKAAPKPKSSSSVVDDATYFGAVPPELRKTVSWISELAKAHGFIVERRITGTGAASARLRTSNVGSWPITIAKDGVWVDLGAECPALRDPDINRELRRAILVIDPGHRTANDPKKTYTSVRYEALRQPEQRRALGELFSIVRRAIREGLAT